MPATARVTDRISHGGSILVGSPTTTLDGLAVARVNDTVHCNTHGTQHITTGSTTVTIDGLAVARVGDHISCGATITTGSNTGNSDS